MILMILILIMMIIIVMACTGVARGGIYCVEDGYRWDQHRSRDQ
jgi:hypothetical protein